MNLSRKQEAMYITRVDLESHTIHLTVGGYPVTAVCKQQSAPEIFENVRNILIGSIIERANKPMKEDTPIPQKQHLAWTKRMQETAVRLPQHYYEYSCDAGTPTQVG